MAVNQINLRIKRVKEKIHNRKDLHPDEYEVLINGLNPFQDKLKPDSHRPKLTGEDLTKSQELMARSGTTKEEMLKDYGMGEDSFKEYLERFAKARATEGDVSIRTMYEEDRYLVYLYVT